jgi:hypothetical protein
MKLLNLKKTVDTKTFIPYYTFTIECDVMEFHAADPKLFKDLVRAEIIRESDKEKV